MCRIEELCRKDVINLRDGCRLGFVEDVEIEMSDGRVAALVIYGRSRLFGLLGRDDDICIPWGCIDKIGEDIILVNFDAPLRRRGKRKGWVFEYLHGQ